MEKNIKITRPSGEDSYKVLCAFKNGENSYLVIDSKLKDANENTITFVCKENGNNLESIDGEEWEQAKTGLINIVKGNEGVSYVDTKDDYVASDNIGHPIALTDAHISVLVNSYKLPEPVVVNEPIKEEINEELNTPVVEEIAVEQPVIPQDNLQNAIEAANNIEVPTEEPIAIVEDNNLQIPENEQNLTVEQPSIEPVAFEQQPNIENNITPDLVQPSEEIPVPIIPEINEVQPIEQSNVEPVIEPQPVIQEPIINMETPIVENTPVVEETPIIQPQISEQPDFDNNLSVEDLSIEEIRNKINSLCDLLIEKEKKINEKEQMIDAKLEVANIAYQNAQNVNQMNNNMDNEVIGVAEYQPEGQSRTLVA